MAKRKEVGNEHPTVDNTAVSDPEGNQNEFDALPGTEASSVQTPADRMAAARAAKRNRGQRSEIKYLVIAGSKDGMSDTVVHIAKSLRGAKKWIEQCDMLLRASYGGVVVVRGKVVGVFGGK